MNYFDETIVVQLTGSGRGAVATVVVAGPLAEALVQARFRSMTKRPVKKQATEENPVWILNKPYFGNWSWLEYVEELVICRTGDQQFEIHCHGGRLASANIIESLVDGGARLESQQTWLNNTIDDRWVRSAIERLASSQTERTTAILMDQVRGALRTELAQIADSLENARLEDAKKRLSRLVDMSELGCRLHQPFSVVLIGPPNSGKSSLINAIVGFQRSVVFDQPGTTRDLVRVETAINGWPILLTDTAGVRESDDSIEQEGIRLAVEQLRCADLVLIVDDLSRDAKPDFGWLNDANQKQLRVGTKADLVDLNGQPMVQRQSNLGVVTSATTKLGIDDLQQAIASKIVPIVPSPGEAVPLCPKTISALVEIKKHVEENDVKLATTAMNALLA